MTARTPESGTGARRRGACAAGDEATAPTRAPGIGAVMSGGEADVLPRRVRRRMKKNASPPAVVSPNDARMPKEARSSDEGASSGTNPSAAPGAGGASLLGWLFAACSCIASHHPSIAVGDGDTAPAATGERSDGEFAASAVGDAVAGAVGAAVGAALGGGGGGGGGGGAGFGFGVGFGGAGVGVGRGAGAATTTADGATLESAPVFFPLVALNEYRWLPAGRLSVREKIAPAA